MRPFGRPSAAAKPLSEIIDDPEFPFMVGRLVGAAEMAAQLLMNNTLSYPELQGIGARLHQTAGWFLEGEDVADAEP